MSSNHIAMVPYNCDKTKSTLGRRLASCFHGWME